jgi:hypothetical protein
MKEHPHYWKLRKTVTFHQILQGGSYKGVVVLCKTCEAINGELNIEFYKVDHIKGLWFFVKFMKQSMGS